MPKTGVLVMGFGGPDSLDAVGPFMCNLMGREPSDELIARVCERYEAIGGRSPLPEIAATIAEALEAELASRGHDVPVRVGMRYWHPYIAEGVASLREAGAERLVAISLSPFESEVATGAYREALAEECGCEVVVETRPLHELDAFVAAHAESLAAARAAAPDGSLVLFSAHSLPLADLEDDDAYVRGLRATAEAIAAREGWASGAQDAVTFGSASAYGTDAGPQPWALVFQSKGQRPGAWLGPLLDDVIDGLGESVPGVVVSPIGFATDHMETCWDLDRVAAEHAKAAGIGFVRAAVPNAEPRLIGELATQVESFVS